MRCSLGKPVDAFSVLRAAGTLSPAQRADILTALTPTPAVIPTIGNYPAFIYLSGTVPAELRNEPEHIYVMKDSSNASAVGPILANGKQAIAYSLIALAQDWDGYYSDFPSGVKLNDMGWGEFYIDITNLTAMRAVAEVKAARVKAQGYSGIMWGGIQEQVWELGNVSEVGKAFTLDDVGAFLIMLAEVAHEAELAVVYFGGPQLANASQQFFDACFAREPFRWSSTSSYNNWFGKDKPVWAVESVAVSGYCSSANAQGNVWLGQYSSNEWKGPTTEQCYDRSTGPEHVPDPDPEPEGPPVVENPPNLPFFWRLQSGLTNSEMLRSESVFDVDGFDTEVGVVAQLISNGKYPIAYFSGGTWEEWRDDADDFPEAALANPMDDWEGERWLDTREVALLQPIMEGRVAVARAKGFKAIEWDNLDVHENVSEAGIAVTEAQQKTYLLMLATITRAAGLAPIFKNCGPLSSWAVEHFDGCIAESPYKYNEIADYAPWWQAGKPLWVVEYSGTLNCSDAVNKGIWLSKYTEDLDEPPISACY